MRNNRNRRNENAQNNPGDSRRAKGGSQATFESFGMTSSDAKKRFDVRERGDDHVNYGSVRQYSGQRKRVGKLVVETPNGVGMFLRCSGYAHEDDGFHVEFPSPVEPDHVISSKTTVLHYEPEDGKLTKDQNGVYRP